MYVKSQLLLYRNALRIEKNKTIEKNIWKFY